MVNHSKDSSCPSEASSLSAAASSEKIIDDDDQGGQSQLLDLKLSNNHNDDHGEDDSKLKNLNHQNWLVVDEEGEKEESKGSEKARTKIAAKVYTCSFCKREFSTSQALGGHQNAHREERAIAKNQQGAMELGAFANYYPYYPYTFGNNNHSSSLLMNNNRVSSLGVRFDSLIHKTTPSYPWSSSRLAHTTNGWSRPSSSSYVSPLLQPLLDHHRITTTSNTGARFGFLGSKFKGSSGDSMAVTKAVGGDAMLCHGGHVDSSKPADDDYASPEKYLSLKL